MFLWVGRDDESIRNLLENHLQMFQNASPKEILRRTLVVTLPTFWSKELAFLRPDYSSFLPYCASLNPSSSILTSGVFLQAPLQQYSAGLADKARQRRALAAAKDVSLGEEAWDSDEEDGPPKKAARKAPEEAADDAEDDSDAEMDLEVLPRKAKKAKKAAAPPPDEDEVRGPGLCRGEGRGWVGGVSF